MYQLQLSLQLKKKLNKKKIKKKDKKLIERKGIRLRKVQGAMKRYFGKAIV